MKKIENIFLALALISSFLMVGCSTKSPAVLNSSSCDMHLTASVSDSLINSFKKGTIIVHAHSGTGFLFQLNNGAAQSDSTFSNLDPANYRIYVTNSLGCRDSINVIIEP